MVVAKGLVGQQRNGEPGKQTSKSMIDILSAVLSGGHSELSGDEQERGPNEGKAFANYLDSQTALEEWQRQGKVHDEVEGGEEEERCRPLLQAGKRSKGKLETPNRWQSCKFLLFRSEANSENVNTESLAALLEHGQAESLLYEVANEPKWRQQANNGGKLGGKGSRMGIDSAKSEASLLCSASRVERQDNELGEKRSAIEAGQWEAGERKSGEKEEDFRGRQQVARSVQLARSSPTLFCAPRRLQQAGFEGEKSDEDEDEEEGDEEVERAKRQQQLHHDNREREAAGAQTRGVRKTKPSSSGQLASWRALPSWTGEVAAADYNQGREQTSRLSPCDLQTRARPAADAAANCGATHPAPSPRRQLVEGHYGNALSEHRPNHWAEWKPSVSLKLQQQQHEQVIPESVNETHRMLDLNSAAKRLRAAGSWRPPNNLPNAGQVASYKVAQRQLIEAEQLQRRQQDKFTITWSSVDIGERAAPTTSGASADNSNEREAGEQEVGVAIVDTRLARGRAHSVQARASNLGGRLARPGRSPVSLQRQTNARLARHKYKLQAQRQEQLAQLERRERELMRGAASRQRQQSSHALASLIPATSITDGRHLSTSPVEIEILEAHNNQEDNRQSGSPSPSYLSRLLGRFVAGSGKSTASQSDLSTELAGSAASCRQQHLQGTTSTRLQREANGNAQQQQQSRLGPSPASSGHHRQVVVRTANNLDQRMQQQQSAPKRFSSPPSSSSLPGHSDKAARQQRRAMKANENEADDFETICSSSSSSASSTLSLNKPFCKICHLSSTKNGDKLISPCKCSGTMQYIHCGCLLKWLEISNRANEKTPLTCELCAHEYTWHKRFNFKQMRLPRCSFKDILLHILFVLSLCLMLLCALTPMIHKSLKSNRNSLETMVASDSKPNVNPSKVPNGGGSPSERAPAEQSLGVDRYRYMDFDRHILSSTFNGFSHTPMSPSSLSTGANGRLASEEKLILICAALFFIAFFLAIYVQTKARDTLYGLIVKFADMNLTYYITEYDHGSPTAPSPTSTSAEATIRADRQQPPSGNISGGQQATTTINAEPNRNAQSQSSHIIDGNDQAIKL